jgi:UDP-MurNAc hydroxylase
MVMRATSLGHAGLLVETDHGSIVCDPWFLPAFFGSWFVFPRNDRLAPDLLRRVEHADHLYISHLHADHLDEPWLADHIDRDITVLLPGFPSDELERRLAALGFRNVVRTVDGQPVRVGRDAGIEVAIHVETAITDGPGGDSAIVISDGHHRIVNQNDCRPHDLAALAAHGPVDVQFLQFSGAIWYPMVYDEPIERLREQCAAKVESQYARAMRYVEAVDAKVVVPSAGPPAFLDPDLFAFNVIDGDELSIFPDATDFLVRLQRAGHDTGRIVVPGACAVIGPDGVTIEQPNDDPMRPYRDKRAELTEYALDWAPWLEAHRATWHASRPGLVERVQSWWQPLLDAAPTLSAGVGAGALIQAGDVGIYVDFPAGTVRAHAGEPYGFRFDIARELVETVVDRREVDWSNALFLSCRFRAWRAGPYNEFLYNFLKSLSPERIARAEAEAVTKRGPQGRTEEIELGGYVMERWCPHRRADLKVFGEIDGTTLTCNLHGWQFDLRTGRCLTADDRHLIVRPASAR